MRLSDGKNIHILHFLKKFKNYMGLFNWHVITMELFKGPFQ